MTDVPQDIADALIVLLAELVKRRKAASKLAAKSAFTPPMMVDAASFAGKPIPTREEGAVNFIVAKPIEGALTLAIRKLGERAYAIGGNQGLFELSDKVCGGPEGEHFMGILNSKWDGIGDWHA